MPLWRWVRSLSVRQVAGLTLIAVLYLIAMRLPVAGDATIPSAEQSAAIGWQQATVSDHLARDVHERVNDERAARGLGG